MVFSRLAAPTIAVAAALALGSADVAEARIGGGRSFGSRGSRTYMTPPATNTAPSVAPIDRSMTQKGSPAAAAQAARPSGVGAAQPSRFGLRGLLMGGLFAAGLASIFGIGALASALGFLLQFALIAGIIYFAVSFFRSRSQPALSRAPARGTGGPSLQNVLNRRSSDANAGSSTLPIGQGDLDSFEKLLGEIQTAYGREDADELGAKTTPEMLSHFLQELSDNAKQGLRNEVSDIKLLRGDLSEAWRENGSDYATVALHYSLIDATVERATGRVVSGNHEQATEATELWTFRRDDRAHGDGWQLSAIQQTA